MLVLQEDVEPQLRAAFGTTLALYERVGVGDSLDDECGVMVELPVAAVARLVVRIRWRHVGATQLELQARLVGAVMARDGEAFDADDWLVPSAIVGRWAARHTISLERDASIGGIVARLLCGVLRDLKTAWHEDQLQTLRTRGNPRLAFEEELLRHASALELAHVERIDGTSEMVLALLARNEDAAEMKENEASRSRPRPAPAHLILRAPMDASASKLQAWRIETEYADEMSLSRKVVGMPTWSTYSSAVELFNGWQKAYETQWHWRRRLVEALRETVIVLEYDPVDFSLLHLVVQDHPSPDGRLVLAILRVEFTATFVVTRCLSDMAVTLLDGVTALEDAPVLTLSSVTMDPSSDAHDGMRAAQQLDDSLRILEFFYL
ncbi:hypothetical protein ATCC90586_004258 [Pythium insidiosum]|nr:hypothetical protein ATCC90586_004258 [Pythium insidiosum]